MNLTVQPCPSSWLSLKPLWLSNQPTLFLVSLSSWGCAKTCQCHKGEYISCYLDSSWLEARPWGSSFWSMHIYLSGEDWEVGFSVGFLWVEPWGSQLRMVSFSATVLLNPWTQRHWPPEPGYQGLGSLGSKHDSPRTRCVHCSSLRDADDPQWGRERVWMWRLPGSCLFREGCSQPPDEYFISTLPLRP